MMPAFIIFLAWIAFGGSHLYLSASGLRDRVSRRNGPAGFTVLFSAVTCLTMCSLIIVTVIYGDKGIAGPNLGKYSWARWGLGVLAAGGCLLAVAGLLNYPKSPMAVLARRQRESYLQHRSLKPPSSVERVSRHPFFAGLAALMLAHTLLASTLAGAVYFGGFVLLALIGIPLQDRKLTQRWQETYIDFLDNTRSLPFAPPKTHRLGPAQWGVWGLAVILTVIFFGILHPFWARWNGATFAVFILIFGMTGVVSALFLQGRKAGN